MEKKPDVKERLQAELERVAEEIRQHGADSLYCPEQWVTGGRIVIEISHSLLSTVTYERKVVPTRKVL